MNIYNIRKGGKKMPRTKESNLFAIAILFVCFALVGGMYIDGGITGAANIDKFPKLLDESQVTLRRDVSTDNDIMIGESTAPVTIIEFCDLRNIDCQNYHKMRFADIKRDYITTGKVKYVYRDFVEDFRLHSQKCAEALECARDQSDENYWEMFDYIRTHVTVSPSDLKNFAAEIVRDPRAFNFCLDSGAKEFEVKADTIVGANSGVTALPTLFINGRKLSGEMPYDVIQKVIEEELASS
jgi:protein-disulfide isomerase